MSRSEPCALSMRCLLEPEPFLLVAPEDAVPLAWQEDVALRQPLVCAAKGASATAAV